MRFVLASFLLLLAIPCLLAAAYLYGRRLTRWSRTKGQITAVTIRSSKHLTTKGHMFYHQILVTVEYTLNGQPFQRRLNPQTTADDLPLAEQLAATKYQPNQPIVIYYSTADPEEITVRPDEDWEGFVPRLATAGVLLTIIGVLLAL